MALTATATHMKSELTQVSDDLERVLDSYDVEYIPQVLTNLEDRINYYLHVLKKHNLLYIVHDNSGDSETPTTFTLRQEVIRAERLLNLR